MPYRAVNVDEDPDPDDGVTLILYGAVEDTTDPACEIVKVAVSAAMDPVRAAPELAETV